MKSKLATKKKKSKTGQDRGQKDSKSEIQKKTSTVNFRKNSYVTSESDLLPSSMGS